MLQGTTAIREGLADPVRGAQETFRALLDAFSRPGRLIEFDAPSGAPSGLPPAAAVVLLSLIDYETPVWLPDGMVGDVGRWLTFHTGAAVTPTPADARFAVLPGQHASPLLAEFPVGEDRYPDKSATVVVLADALDGGPRVALSGPGIKGTAEIAPRGLRLGFWDEVARNNARFPLGVDLVLVAGRLALALPRSTAVRPVQGGA